MAGGGRYNGMMLAADSTYLGPHSQPSGLADLGLKTGMVRDDSMDAVNDPRFFNDNVINYRLAAFGGLSVVSALMVSNTMTQLFDMNKQMDFFNEEKLRVSLTGCLQLVSFCLIVIVLFQNMLAVYIGVAQPYHVIRLMTAGPTGFDAAASYYLNRTIVSWRHMAIKGMLIGLPLYLVQMSLRVVVKFDRETQEPPPLPEKTPVYAFVQGIVFCCLMQALAFTLMYVHREHSNIFRDRYEVMTEMVKPLQGALHQQMMTRSFAAAAGNKGMFGFLDV